MSSSLLRKDFLDLPEVVDVVTCVKPGDGLDGFLAALGMHAMIFPLCGRKRFQQIKIGLAECSEALERSACIRLAVTHGLRPFVLIECLNGTARHAQDRTD